MKKLIVLLMCCLVLGGCGSKDTETVAEVTTALETELSKAESEADNELRGDENDSKEYPTAEQLLIALKEKNENLLEIQVFDEETDPNKNLGRPGEYISKGNFSDSRVEENGDELSAGTIETFNTKEECDKRTKYLEKFADSSMGAFGLNQYVYKYDLAIFRVSYDLTTEQAEEYHQQMNDIITEWENTGEIALSESASPKKESNSQNDDIINQLKELYKGEAKNKLSYTEENSDSCFEVVLKSSKELAKSAYGASPEEMVDNILFNPFAVAAGYLCNNHEEDTDYGKAGNMAFDLLGFVILGDDENINKILSEYDEIATKYGMTIITLEEEEKQVEVSAEPQTQEPIELSTGNYIVGEDIPAGKYDIIGVNKGNIHVCSEGKDYGDIVNEIIEPGETVYANVRLKDGYTVEVVLGGKIQLQPK